MVLIQEHSTTYVHITEQARPPVGVIFARLRRRSEIASFDKTLTDLDTQEFFLARRSSHLLRIIRKILGVPGTSPWAKSLAGL
jgi:hypothetical protein